MNCANHPDRERVAFCQNCGKPLCQECTRAVGSAVFCEPCLATKLAAAGVPSSGGAYTTTPAGGSYTYTGTAGDTNYKFTGAVPPPRLPGEPNPGLAALLGFIPGVGAMYNGQYAKGVVHLVVFAILVSLANENGIFGLFIAGWIFYQVIEAHHTARARRDGTPLPNPFGLNDLGERLGFGRAWPGPVPPPNSGFSAPGATANPASGGAAEPPFSPPQGAFWFVPPPASWENYTQAPPAYGVPPYPVDPGMVPPASRFPTGAIWLIGLGCVFLIGNAGLFHHFPIYRLLPFFLIGVGVWIFVHKMTETGTLADDGTPAYRYRLYCAIRSSIWVVLVGVLFLLDSFGILSWGHSWPLFLVAAGVIAIFRRVSYPGTAFPYQAPAATAPPAAAPAAPPAAASTSIVPSTPHDQEGS